MPIYEFACRRCDERFECLTRIGGEAEIRCPACGGSELRKLLSAFGIGGGGSRLKSSGDGCSTCSGKSCSTCR